MFTHQGVGFIRRVQIRPSCQVQICQHHRWVALIKTTKKRPKIFQFK